MLNICGISKSYGTRRLFSGVTFTVGSSDHVALIGANGTGKTTLFDIIAGRTPADSGAVSTARGATIGYLRQEEYSSCGRTLLEEVSSSCDTLTALADKIRRLQEELATEKDAEASAVLLKKLGEIEHLYDARGGYDSSHRAKIILAGLGFSEEDFNRSPLEFSGGWQTRIHLGKLLFINPDILLLDEPTNYLDLETQRWFESYLKQYRGAVLFTSHDRVFINNTADKIIAIEPPEIIFHHGDYDSYVEARKKEEGILQATARRQEESINRQMRFVERFRYKATKARQVQSRIKLLQKIERVHVPRAGKKIHFNFPEPARSGRVVIELKDVSKAYEAHRVYQGLSLSLERGDKAAIVGANGAGKSTLLRIMAGVLPFESGTRALGHNVETAYFAQHYIETLNPDFTILEELRKAAPDEPEQKLRGLLGSFLFPGDDVLKKIDVLSGGEKTRLALCKMLVRPANFILLDEPTNHLDIPSREILADALNEYNGTLCLITHDRSLIADTASKIIEVNRGEARVFSGGYEEYLSYKEAAEEEEEETLAAGPATAPHSTAFSTPSRRELKVKEGELRNALYREITPVNNRIEEVEAQTDTVTGRIKELEVLMADPSHYSDGGNEVAANVEYRELKDRLTALTAEWEDLLERAEAIKEKYRLAREELG